MSLLLFAFLALAPAGFAEGYTNTNSVEAERSLAKIAGRESAKLGSDADRKEWAKARLAWIALARLEGRNDQAMALFEGCGKICGKFGPAEEWKAARAWGCRMKPSSKACEK